MGGILNGNLKKLKTQGVLSFVALIGLFTTLNRYPLDPTILGILAGNIGMLMGYIWGINAKRPEDEPPIVNMTNNSCPNCGKPF